MTVLADGAPIPLDAGNRAHLPAGAREIRLCRRSFVPAWRGLADDRRRLGVAVVLLRLGGRKLPRAAFGRGWHTPEPGLRWTDGDAHVTLTPQPHGARFTLATVAAGARYWSAPEVVGVASQAA